MNYGADWIHPARTTTQVRCTGPNCTPDGVPGPLVMACTVDENGWCAACARTADDSNTQLRMEAQ